MFCKKLNKSDFMNVMLAREALQFNRIINFTIA